MALVSARPTKTASNSQEEQPLQQDKDLARAETLLQLHQTVKLAYSAGARPGNLSDEFRDLYESRTRVHRVLQQLDSTEDSARHASTESAPENDNDETEAWS